MPMRPALAGAGARWLTPLVVLTAVAIILVGPASARMYRIADKETPSDVAVVDCPQSPAGHDGAWVRANCKVAPAGAAAQVAREDSMMIIGWSHEVQSPRDAN